MTLATDLLQTLQDAPAGLMLSEVLEQHPDALRRLAQR